MRAAREEFRWRRAGRPIPPPHHIKSRALRRAARRYGVRIFVETGTYRGETVAALAPHFERLYSVELHEGNFSYSRDRFADDPRITILHGDSAARLRDILDELDQPALFWLDAHDSGPGTAAAQVDPIRAELDALFAHPVRSHVVYIDDARSFEGRDGYPTIAELRELCGREWPDAQFSVVDDVIRIEP